MTSMIPDTGKTLAGLTGQVPVGQWEGLPFMSPNGQAPTLRTSLEKDQPEMAKTARAQVFDMSDVEDVEAYRQAWDEISNGKALFGAEERTYCGDIKNWRILLRWALLSYTSPKGTVTKHGNTQIYTGAPAANQSS